MSGYYDEGDGQPDHDNHAAVPEAPMTPSNIDADLPQSTAAPEAEAVNDTALDQNDATVSSSSPAAWPPAQTGEGAPDDEGSVFHRDNVPELMPPAVTPRDVIVVQSKNRKPRQEYSKNPNTIRVRQRQRGMTPYQRAVDGAMSADKKAVSAAWRTLHNDPVYAYASAEKRSEMLDAIEAQELAKRKSKRIDAGSKIAVLNTLANPDDSQVDAVMRGRHSARQQQPPDMSRHDPSQPIPHLMRPAKPLTVYLAPRHAWDNEDEVGQQGSQQQPSASSHSAPGMEDLFPTRYNALGRLTIPQAQSVMQQRPGYLSGAHAIRDYYREEETEEAMTTNPNPLPRMGIPNIQFSQPPPSMFLSPQGPIVSQPGRPASRSNMAHRPPNSTDDPVLRGFQDNSSQPERMEQRVNQSQVANQQQDSQVTMQEEMLRMRQSMEDLKKLVSQQQVQQQPPHYLQQPIQTPNQTPIQPQYGSQPASAGQQQHGDQSLSQGQQQATQTPSQPQQASGRQLTEEEVMRHRLGSIRTLENEQDRQEALQNPGGLRFDTPAPPITRPHVHFAPDDTINSPITPSAFLPQSIRPINKGSLPSLTRPQSDSSQTGLERLHERAAVREKRAADVERSQTATKRKPGSPGNPIDVDVDKRTPKASRADDSMVDPAIRGQTTPIRPSISNRGAIYGSRQSQRSANQAYRRRLFVQESPNGSQNRGNQQAGSNSGQMSGINTNTATKFQSGKPIEIIDNDPDPESEFNPDDDAVLGAPKPWSNSRA
ncbi:hypothetical protein F5Y16DRAFT_396864 [Xylariaceae sp. FL0255]|nr:hypothetical protein F5Y16DRAFT_396864 [Xylariaceae sp. FL0255]